METLSKTDQWNIGVQDNPIYEKYGHMEICSCLLWTTLVEAWSVHDGFNRSAAYSLLSQ